MTPVIRNICRAAGVVVGLYVGREHGAAPGVAAGVAAWLGGVAAVSAVLAGRRSKDGVAVRPREGDRP